jgi:hypothetical protein
MSGFLFSRFVVRDGSFGRWEEYGSCPNSLVLPFQSGGGLDQGALTGRERNAQVIILSFFRVFTLSNHTASLNKAILHSVTGELIIAKAAL